MNQEQKRALALAAARKRKAEAESSEVDSTPVDNSFLGGLESRAQSVVQGVTDPVYGVAQLITNATGFGDEAVNQLVQNREQYYDQARAKKGREGFDMYRMTGGMALPGGAATKVISPKSKGYVNLLKGMAIGGASGASAPVVGDDFWTEKGVQTAVGAALGPAFQAVGKGLKYGKEAYDSAKDKFGPVFEDANKTLSRLLRDAIPEEKRAEVVAKLRANENPMTQGSVGESTADLNIPQLAALQDVSDAANPNRFADINTRQWDARQGAIESLSGRAIQPGRTADDLTVAKNIRNSETGVMRDNALDSATSNTAMANKLKQDIKKLSTAGDFPEGSAVSSVPDAVRGRYSLEADVQQAERGAQNMYNPAGYKIPPRYAPQQNMLDVAGDFVEDAKFIEATKKFELDEAESLAKSMDAYGIEPLSSSNVNARLQTILDNPQTGTVAQTIIKKMMRAVNNEAQDGVIDPVRLYRMRKLDLQQTAERLMGKEGAQEYQGGLVREAQKALDDAIESAAGGGWKAYLKKYSEMSRGIDEMEGARKLGDKLFPEGQTQMGSVTSGQSKGYTKILRELEEGRVLSPDAQIKLNEVQQDLARTAKYKDVAAQGNTDIAGTVGNPTLPNALWREVMITNNVLKGLSAGKQTKVQNALPELFRSDPQKGFQAIIDLIEDLPPEQQTSVMAEIQKLAPNMAQMIGGGGFAAGQITDQTIQ